MPRKISFNDRLWLILAEVRPLGRLPIAPGTWGSAGAAIAAPFILLPLPYIWRGLLILAVLAAGVVAASHAERILGRPDPGSVVIDEVAGQWLTLAPFAQLSWGMVLAGFLFFRLFDIAKPWPVKWADRKFEGGFGIMLDDCLAGVYAALALWVLGLLV